MKKDEYLEPQKIKGFEEKAWYYVNKKSVDVVYEVRGAAGAYIKTEILRIPLKRVIALFEQQ